MFRIPNPDEYISASDVKDVADEVISPLPLPGVEGSPLDPGDIWLVVILACVNQSNPFYGPVKGDIRCREDEFLGRPQRMSGNLIALIAWVNRISVSTVSESE